MASETGNDTRNYAMQSPDPSTSLIPSTTGADADIRHLRFWYDAFQLSPEPDRQRAFLALVRAWLLRYSSTSTLPLPTDNTIDIDTVLEDAVLAFLLLYSPRLWPTSATRGRGHLVPGAFLDYRWDVIRSDSGEGERPRLFARRWGSSRLRQALRMYFCEVNRMGWRSSEDGNSEDGEEGLDGLFAEVIRPS